MIVYDRYGNQHLLDYRSDPRFHYGNHATLINNNGNSMDESIR